MAAHTHWAVMVTARAGAGNGVSLAEVQMRATPGGADQCTGGTASGAANGGTSAANAFDDDAATQWYNGSTGGTSVRLAYQFASPVTVQEVHARLPGAAATYPGATYGPAACWVQWSDDGTTWTWARGAADLSELGNAGELAFSVSDAALPVRWGAGSMRLAPRAWALSGAAHAGLVTPQYDHVDGGLYRIAGTVAIDGTPITPVRRRVRLFDQRSGRLVRQTWSAPITGAWAFERLRLAKYIVVTQDHTLLYDPVARDGTLPVP